MNKLSIQQNHCKYNGAMDMEQPYLQNNAIEVRFKLTGFEICYDIKLLQNLCFLRRIYS